ncbi:MAG: hypothetical protein ACFFDK_05320 [Promethearchaeota archaeon]
MSGSNIKEKLLKPEEKSIYGDHSDKKLIKIEFDEYEALLSENKALKGLISDRIIEKMVRSPESNQKEYNKNSKIDLNFYVKIILAIIVIMLSLAFHIVYLSVASCLFYTNGSSDCWVKSWLGIPVYASFFIDLTLYLLIGFQLVLIILILRSKISELKSKK